MTLLHCLILAKCKFEFDTPALDQCALLIADTSSREPCASRSLEVENTVLILRYF